MQDMTTNAVAATCPLCHTEERAMTNEMLAAGGSWHCSRCTHLWSAVRLATAAAYAAFEARRL